MITIYLLFGFFQNLSFGIDYKPLELVVQECLEIIQDTEIRLRVEEELKKNDHFLIHEIRQFDLIFYPKTLEPKSEHSHSDLEISDSDLEISDPDLKPSDFSDYLHGYKAVWNKVDRLIGNVSQRRKWFDYLSLFSWQTNLLLHWQEAYTAFSDTYLQS